MTDENYILDDEEQREGYNPVTASLTGGVETAVMVSMQIGAGASGEEQAESEPEIIVIPPTPVFNTSEGDDTIIGDIGNNTVFSGGGNDVFVDSLGNDAYFGEGDIDTVEFTAVTQNLIISLGEYYALHSSGEYDYIHGIENATGGSGDDRIVGDTNVNVLNGGGGNDYVIGGGASDTLYGGDGDDFVFGDYTEGDTGIDGNDTLFGDAGNDKIYGGGGNDIIDGGTGRDFMDGGTGQDTLDFTNAAGRVIIDIAGSYAVNQNGEIDTFINFERINGSNFNDTIVGDTAGNILYGGGGADIITGAAGGDNLFGGDGNDTLWGDYDAETGIDGADYFEGGLGNDTMFGMGGADTFIGQLGHDVIYGGSGIDTIDYSSNTFGLYAAMHENYILNNNGYFDTIYDVENLIGTNVRDYIVGTEGANNIQGLGGNDTLSGMYGVDTIYGGDGNDWLIGDFIAGNTAFDGNDILYGEGGDDFLIGMGGIDEMFGGSGNDTFLYEAGDIFHGGDDFDVIRMISNATTDWNMNSVTGTSIEHIGLDNLNGWAAANTFTFRHTNIDNLNDQKTIYITGDVGLDTVINTAINATYLQGTIQWNGKLMDLYVRNGYNMFIEQGLLDGTEETNGLIGDEFDNVLTGTAEIDTIIGNGGADTIDGLAGADIIQGGAGNDRITYDAADIINGGADFDTLVVNNGSTVAVTLDTSMTGIDGLDLRNGGAANTATLRMDHIDNFSDANTVYIYGEAGIDSITIEQLTAGNFQTHAVVNGAVMALHTRNGNSVYYQHGILNGGETGDGFIGTTGDDTITGTANGDVIFAYAGNDIITATDNDVVYGSTGTDTVRTSAGVATALDINDLYGVEVLNFENGAADTITFSMTQALATSDTTTFSVRGDVGVDTITITQLNHNSDLQSVSDVGGIVIAHYLDRGLDLYIEWGLGTFTNGPTGQGIIGDGTGETINGTAGGDAIFAYGGDDTINAGAGADTVYAGDGDDILYYDDPNDMLYGGAGTDTMRLQTGDTIGLNSGSLRSDVDSIEVLDMTNGVANTAIIRMSHILDFGENDLLYVLGDANDVVDARQLNTTSHFVGTVDFNGTTFDHYQNAGADLYVEQGITIL